MNYTGTSLLYTVLFNTATDAWWSSVFLWVIRVTIFSLLLRSYLMPWLLAALSKHVRIRTVSPWSIRGLYIRAGPRIIRVDRVRYGYSLEKGVNVRLDGLNIELGRSPPKPPPLPTLRHNRRLTLADFAPSPMAHRLWNLLSSAYAVVEPFFRPLIRTWVVAGLRLLIRWLPHILSGLNFEAHATTFTFPDLPGTVISAEKLTLNATLAFTELEKVMDTSDHTKMPRSLRSRHSYGVAAWRRRFAASFQRTLDRAWGKAQGKASISIKLHDIGGSTPPAPSSTGKEVEFLRLPGAIDFKASMGFNPRKGTADTHSLDVSLDVGDCSLEMDTLKLLLTSLKPKALAPELKTPSSPLPYYGPVSPVASPSTAGSEGLFSPQSSIMSPGTDSPSSPLLSPEVLSPSSPSSPFLEALSASIRPRRRHLYKPRIRLNDLKNTSMLSVLNSACLKISAITLATHRKWGQDPYELKIQEISISSKLCNDRSEDTFHRRWLGRGKTVERYDPDTYDFEFFTRKIAVERRTRLDSMRLLTVETVDFQALATQWPAPWLAPSGFMSGDPNTPLLAIRGKIGLVAHMGPPTKEGPSQLTNSSTSFAMPRLAIELQCGTLRARIICADTKLSAPFAVELRNNGIVISAESNFGDERRVNTRQQAPDNDRRQLRMDYKFLRSRTKMDTRRFSGVRSFDADFLDDPSILSIESFECFGEGHAIASVAHDDQTVASVDSSSPVLDLHISSDALCVELWNPHVIVAIQHLLSHSPPSSSKPLLDRLPAGISATAAIARLVVFDTLDLSRGFACRTGLSIHYSSMHSGHAHRFHDLPQQEQIVEANATAYVRITLAAATQYDADNPAFDHLEYLRLSGKRGTVLSKTGDSCEVSVVVRNVKATFQLAHVYSIMLGIQGLKSLPPDIPRRAANHGSPAQLAFRVKAMITTLQVLLALRIDGIEAHAIPDRPRSVHLSKLLVWVHLPFRVNKWQDENGFKWQEFICFQSLNASIAPSHGTARLRVPFGYGLADLITDLTVTAKAIRHLGHITAQQEHSPMRAPGAEGPKAIPGIIIRIRSICVEAKLAGIWRCGLEAEAFRAKSEVPSGPAGADQDYHFGADHSVSIDEARRRLDENLRQKHSKAEDAIDQNLRAAAVPNIVEVTPSERIPPLFRLLLNGESLPDFLHAQGGLPRETEFSLLVPLHLNFTIPPNEDRNIAALEFDTDLVIGEEMGSEQSVWWVDCPILEPDYGVRGAHALSISIPKTIMPVKTYANPVIQITTSATTILSWGVSYTPAIQDLMRVIETLSPPPRDPSPPVGFWDKMRLMFHWSLVATFRGEVRFHMKGSRDPHKLSDEGAGFNEDKELIQVISDSMLIAIPNLEHLYPRNQEPMFSRRIPESSKPFRKICVKVRSGVRFGVGFVLERACGKTKAEVPEIKTPSDSFNGFRSDFIHMSISLASSTRNVVPGSNHEPSSIHLTPKAFAHFWSWSGLFDSALSLPTRQGSYYPPRIVSPKLGRHLATLKYRLHIRHLFIMHAYIDESRETWADGVVPWVGVKGLIEEVQADLHQRDEESVVPGLLPDTTKVLRRKPVYAAEVSLKGLDLRALLATFKEPLRESIEMIAPPQRSNYRVHQNLPTTPSVSVWHDSSDFIEVDWSPSSEPTLHLLPVVTCPQFTYFKRNSVGPHNSTHASKFGLEESHSCLLGKSLAVPQVQIEIAGNRIKELRRLIRNKRSKSNDKSSASLENMVTLLEDYVSLLRGPDKVVNGDGEKSHKSHLMPSYTVSPDEWAEFENVYHIHCPKIVMDSAIRDIMMQYYYCSRARKGLEYHMATRAVKFIRDQAEAALDEESDSEEDQKLSGATATAHMAASALRKMLKGDASKPSVEISTDRDRAVQHLEEFDPLQGWSEGISLRKSHCCLLLKPQIVMRGEGSKDALILAAVQAKLQAFAIMDDSNADDPISGNVMSRSLTSLSGLQTYAPAVLNATENIYVPLEVLLDPRCESSAFDQLVPQTDAAFQYDKFNRLRLRTSITSATRTSTDKSVSAQDSHLQDQTDLVRVHIPRFTVSASDEHFGAISHIVTKLLLFSDAAHKTRLEKLETLLFTYDFTDLVSAAQVIADLQARLGDAIETQQTAEYNHSRRLEGEEGQLEMLKLKAHIFLLSEELNFLFDAIKLAQDRYDDHTDQKSALLLHASSSEISWKMLDDRRDLLAKIVVRNIDFHWLSRQDSSTTNNLTVGNLQAFDGSRHALWTEILSKHDEPANHPLLKRGLFLLASWTVLAPVGGITIYESFEMSLHPMRLQIDARVGRRIMEYVWPARKHRNEIDDAKNNVLELRKPTADLQRTSLDSPRALHGPRSPHESSKGELVPPLRKLGASRSFTDLRRSATAKDNLLVPTIHKMPSSETMRQISNDGAEGSNKQKGKSGKKDNDAAEMKIRTSQKSFVLVKISSMNLLLSIAKEGSFECNDARIRTRDLEYRNQTWSFEELVNQFIPSDTSWRGWVKMAFQQPLLPVLPVARELISKTKWIPSSSKTATQVDIKGPPPRLPRAKVLSIDDDSELTRVQSKYTRAKSKSPSRGWLKASHRKLEPPPQTITSLPLTDEPESFGAEVERPSRPTGRKRMMSLFNRSSSKGNSIGSSTTLRPSEEK
ncbi:golgi-body localization protein domain-containing protein [Lyophyllum atratum]|nr:golgi-body localization protein domain-containing protein [Lyophyllum atratum]